MSICKEYKKISLVGFDDLVQFISLVNFNIFSLNIFFRIFKKYITFVDKLKIPFLFINRIKEGCNGAFIFEKAIFDINLNVAFDCYFQNEVNFRKEIFSEITKQVAPDISINDKYFVHVRRGDYLSWPSKNKPASLDDSWYFRQIEFIRAADPSASFVFYGDDLAYLKLLSMKVNSSSVFHQDSFSDFRSMLSCVGGVLSPSSYSWWVAKIISHRNPKATLVAPNFWIGHRSDVWIPHIGIKSSFLIYKD